MPFQRFTYPLDMLDAVRRWLPGAARWKRDSARLRPDPSEDWLLEPTAREEAQNLFPQLGLRLLFCTISGYQLKKSLNPR